MIAIVDLGLGNLGSVQRAFQRIGEESCITQDSNLIASADGVVLPGQGNFAAASNTLDRLQLRSVLRETAARVPLLGICLGMQLFFDRSEEGGRGLGLFPGEVVRLRNAEGPLPHMGWSPVHIRAASGLLKSVADADFYFCHSYVAAPHDRSLVLATATYGDPFCAACGCGSIVGVQFHPEKSSSAGRGLLQSFATGVRAWRSIFYPPLMSTRGAS